MMIVALIAVAWLVLAVLFALVCRMAALADSAPPPDTSTDARSSAEQLLLWQELSGIELRDLRPDRARLTAERAPSGSHVG